VVRREEGVGFWGGQKGWAWWWWEGGEEGDGEEQEEDA
jgi:hypothetical protein